MKRFLVLVFVLSISMQVFASDFNGTYQLKDIESGDNQLLMEALVKKGYKTPDNSWNDALKIVFKIAVDGVVQEYKITTPTNCDIQ